MFNTHWCLSRNPNASYTEGTSEGEMKPLMWWGVKVHIKGGKYFCRNASVWSRTFAFHFSSSDKMNFSGGALFCFQSGLFFLQLLLLGDPHREINFARPLCLWRRTSACINIHMRLFQMLSWGTGAPDELRGVWSSGLYTHVSLDRFSRSSTPISIPPCPLG